MRRFSLVALIVVSSLTLGSCALFDSLFGANTLIGGWYQEASWPGTGGTYKGKIEMKFLEKGALTINFYGWQNNAWVLTSETEGTYLVMSSDILSLKATSVLSLDATSGQLVPVADYTPQTTSAQFSISGNSMTVTVDNDGDGVYDTTYTFANTMPGASATGLDMTYALTKE